MSNIKAFKLQENARTFQAGNYTGYGMKFGKKHKDKNKQDVWTNYECALFTNNQAQMDFYNQILVAGSVVVVSCESEEIDIQVGNDGRSFPKIKLINCKLDDVFSMQPAQQNAAPQGYQQPAPQQPQQPVPTIQSQQARQGYVPPNQQPAPQQPVQQPQQRQQPQQPAAPQPAQQGGGFDDFDNDIPDF